MKQVEVSWALSKLTKPEYVVMVVSISNDGTPNVMPAGWAMRTSGNPALWAVSIGHKRYTHELITQQKEFVVAFPSEGMEEAITFCGDNSGRDIRKFEKCNLEISKAQKVKPPLIQRAVANFECKLHSQMDTGDHTIFVGEVVTAHSEEDRKVLVNMRNFQYKAFAVKV